MSRVNVDLKALTDPRFERLAQLLGLADGDHARAKCEHLWMECTLRGELELPVWLVTQRLGAGGPDALIESELARYTSGRGDSNTRRMYICGARGRTEWHARVKEQSSKAGKARAAKSSRVAGRFSSQVDGASTSPLTLSPSPSPSPSPALSPAHVLEHVPTGERAPPAPRASAPSDSPALAELKTQVDAATTDIAKAQRKRRAPETPIPEDWTPNDKHRELARERGVNLELQARSFRAHAESHDRRCVRWDAAFTQWLLKSNPDPRGSSSDGLAHVLRIARGEIP